MQLNLPPTTEAILRHRAIAAGKDVETFAIQILQELAQVEFEAKPPIRSHDEWVAALREWSSSHPRTNRLVDDSRESIYEGRGL